MLGTYEDFVEYVEEAGFATLSPNALGLPSVAELTEEVRWHTGDERTDPWQWRMRIVEERRAAYAKLLRGMLTFVSRQWYPALYAARRGGGSFEDAWEAGGMRAEAKRIHDLFAERTVLATHEIKRLGGFTGASKGKYDGAMAALQMGMFLTFNGETRMTTITGQPHSWPVTEYSPVDDWAWEGTIEAARKMGSAEAVERIAEQIARLVPSASATAIHRFLLP